MKKYLLGFLLGFVGLFSFCNSELVFSVGDGNRYPSGPISLNAGATVNVGPYWNGELLGYGTTCFVMTNGINCEYDGVTYTSPSTLCFFNNGSGTENFSIPCTNTKSSKSYINTFTTVSIPSSFFSECETCSEVNTGEILSGYILESDVDINYCVGNGLCPNECGSGFDLSGDLQYSNLYINSILHPGKENIFVDIPDYITWDYSTDTGNINIYVGSGYDMDYMNSIIKINSYRPDSEDFTDVFVSGLTLVFPYIFIVLLIVFIWKLLKKIFK